MAHLNGKLFLRAYERWSAQNGQRMGAALAYYALFALAPLLLLGVALASALFGSATARDLVLTQVQTYLGPSGAAMVRGILFGVSRPPQAGFWAAAAGVASLLVGAFSAVMELQSALDQLWDARPHDGGWLAYVRRGALASAFLFIGGAWLFFTVLIGVCISAVGLYLSAWLPVPEAALHGLNFAVSFSVMTPLFAAMFKLLPAVSVAWRHVWSGAAVTALLFTAGSLVLGLYLGKAGLSSEFGAAGSLVAVLIWAYYNAQILYFGAAFTHASAAARGQDRDGPGDESLAIHYAERKGRPPGRPGGSHG